MNNTIGGADFEKKGLLYHLLYGDKTQNYFNRG